MAASTLPPDLFDQTTIVSLFSTVAILLTAYGVSRMTLPSSTTSSLRFLFIWHAFDALIHFCLEGSFLYHCFFSSLPLTPVDAVAAGLYPDPHNFLGRTDLVHGSQAGGANPFAQLWMVYARADKRWAGVDLVCFLLSPPRPVVMAVRPPSWSGTNRRRDGDETKQKITVMLRVP